MVLILFVTFFFSLRVRLENISLFELFRVDEVLEDLGFFVFVLGDVKIVN